MKYIGDIPKIQSLNIDEFVNEYLNKNKPVIIQSALTDWPALRKWDVEYLKQKIGTIPVDFRENLEHKDFDHMHPNIDAYDHIFRKEALNFSDFIDMVLNKKEEERKRFFLTGDRLQFFKQSIMNNDLQSIYHDFSIPSYIPNRADVDVVAFWLSFKGAKTWMHYDSSGDHNLNAQIKGSKTVYLLDPKEVCNLYLLPFSNFSKVNIDRYDESDFPLIKNAEYSRAELNCGDLIFIPGYWFHTFEHTGDININVNFWFKNTSQVVNPLSVRLAIEKSFFNYYRVSPLKSKEFLDENPTLKKSLEQIELWLFSRY